jgi:CxxC-x17-CxxC domain-containing protein
MAYDNPRFGDRPQRQKFNVADMNLKCADCGTPITELPFKPSPDRPVYCFECNKKRRASFQR